MSRSDRPTVTTLASGFTLALGGGGARGYAHLGVADVLAERHLVPGRIIGTSMGAVMGAGLAAGLSVDHIAAMAARIDLWRVAQKRVRLALFDVRPLLEQVVAEVGIARIEDLPIPFAAAAYDLVRGEHRLITTGLVADALIRSCAMNVIFSPVVDGEVVWADGGLWESVPISLARAWSPEPVVGVRVISPKPALFERGPVAWSLRSGARLLGTDARNGRLDARRYAALLGHAITHPVTHFPADLLISPRVGSVRWVRFGDVETPRRRGYVAARQALAGVRIAEPEAEKVLTG